MDSETNLNIESKDNLKSSLEKGIQHKLRANSFFKKNKFKESIKEYENVNFLYNKF